VTICSSEKNQTSVVDIEKLIKFLILKSADIRSNDKRKNRLSVLLVKKPASFHEQIAMDFLFFLFIFGLVPLFFIWLITKILKSQHQHRVLRELSESKSTLSVVGIHWKLPRK
jgi:hypothetical protein